MKSMIFDYFVSYGLKANLKGYQQYQYQKILKQMLSFPLGLDDFVQDAFLDCHLLSFLDQELEVVAFGLLFILKLLEMESLLVLMLSSRGIFRLFSFGTVFMLVSMIIERFFDEL